MTNHHPLSLSLDLEAKQHIEYCAVIGSYKGKHLPLPSPTSPPPSPAYLCPPTLHPSCQAPCYLLQLKSLPELPAVNSHIEQRARYLSLFKNFTVYPRSYAERQFQKISFRYRGLVLLQALNDGHYRYLDFRKNTLVFLKLSLSCLLQSQIYFKYN